MYEEEWERAEQCFRSLKLPVPRVQLYLTAAPYSYTLGEDEIYLGWYARLYDHIIGCDIEGIILHEMLHVFIARQKPPWKLKKLFGPKEAWEGRQKWSRMLFYSENFVNKYASTHPEEDMVECLCEILTSNDWAHNRVLRRKERALRSWLNTVRKRRR